MAHTAIIHWDINGALYLGPVVDDDGRTESVYYRTSGPRWPDLVAALWPTLAEALDDHAREAALWPEEARR